MQYVNAKGSCGRRYSFSNLILSEEGYFTIPLQASNRMLNYHLDAILNSYNDTLIILENTNEKLTTVLYHSITIIFAWNDIGPIHLFLKFELFFVNPIDSS